MLSQGFSTSLCSCSVHQVQHRPNTPSRPDMSPLVQHSRPNMKISGLCIYQSKRFLQLLHL